MIDCIVFIWLCVSLGVLYIFCGCFSWFCFCFISTNQEIGWEKIASPK